MPVSQYLSMPTLHSKKRRRKNGTGLVLESEFSMIKELDHETPQPIGIANQSSLNPLLKGLLSCAHSMTDRDAGDVFNYNLDFGTYATYGVFKSQCRLWNSRHSCDNHRPEHSPSISPFLLLTEDFVILLHSDLLYRRRGNESLVGEECPRCYLSI